MAVVSSAFKLDQNSTKIMIKVDAYSIQADQLVCRWPSLKPDSKLQLLSTRTTVNFPATEQHCPLTRYQIILLSDWVWELAQSCYMKIEWLGTEPLGRESDALTITPPQHSTFTNMNLCNDTFNNNN